MVANVSPAETENCCNCPGSDVAFIFTPAWSSCSPHKLCQACVSAHHSSYWEKGYLVPIAEKGGVNGAQAAT